jgi:DNA-binding CsgD family transcriptional regulator/tetratricopeptide (TPR) repeat protein
VVQTEKLVGRTEAISEFEGLLGAVRLGERKILVVEADAGLGKTMLLDYLRDGVDSHWEVIHAVHDRFATSRPLAGFAPYIPATCWESESAAISMFTFVNETQYDVIQRYCAILEKKLTERPLVIVVDDLQFSDSSTFRFLETAIRQLDGLPVLFVLASRVAPRSDEVGDLFRHLPAEDTRRIRLKNLESAEVAKVAKARLGRAPTPDEFHVLDRAGGSPLFVAALLDRIAKEPIGNALVSASLPLEFREFVLESIMPLRGRTRQFLELASLTERGFTLAELSLLSATDTVTLWDHLRDAVACGVLIETETGLDFRHDLVKSAVYENLPVSVRNGLHRHVAEVFASIGANPVVVANHFKLAGPDAGENALPWLRLAAHHLAGHNSRAALELLDQAVSLCHPGHPERALLDAERAYALCWERRFQEAVDLVDVSLQLTENPVARTQLHLSKMKALLADGKALQSAESLARMLDECEDPSYADEVEVLRGLAYLLAGDHAQAAEHVLPVLQKPAATPLAACLANCVHAQLVAGRLEVFEAVSIVDTAFEHANRDTTGEVFGYLPHMFRLNTSSNVDDLDAMVLASRSGRELAEAKGLSWALPAYHGFDAIRLFDLARFDDAATEAETGLQIAKETGSNLGALVCISALAYVKVWSGDLMGATDVLQRSEEFGGLTGLPLGIDEFVAAQSFVARENADPDSALLILRLLWDEIAQGRLELFSRRLLIPYVHLLCDRFDPEGMNSVLSLIDCWESRSAGNVPSIRAGWLQARALITKSTDDIAKSIEHWRSSWRPLALATALVDGAAIAGEHGLKQMAQGYLREAQEILVSAGAHGALANANRVGGTYGIASKRGRATVRPTTGWSSLSPAELEVARTVASGLTNRQVADRLFVSPRTVEAHLRHVFAKLAVRSRRELSEFVAHRPDKLTGSSR